MKIRTPKIKIGKKGIRLTNIGASIGGKGARLNISRKGVSTSVGGKGASFNSRRGWTLSPFAWLRRLFGKKK